MQEVDTVGARPHAASGALMHSAEGRWMHRLWWLHGIVGAFATLGVLDALNLIPADWLHVVHAVGGRWMDWMRQLSAWLDGWLPFGWTLGAREATFVLVVLVTILPVTLVRAVSHDRHAELVDRVLRYAGLVFVVYGMAIVLAPGKMADTPDIFSSAVVATCVGFILSISATGGRDAEEDKDSRTTRGMLLGVAPLIVLFLGKPLGWAIPDAAYAIAMIGAGLSAFVSVGFILFRIARPYVTAFAVTLGVITGIQLLTIVPAFAQQIAPFF